MKHIVEYKLFERKGNYQLFHKTQNYDNLIGILEDGHIIAGGKDDDEAIWWNAPLRKNVLANWEKDNPKFITISATRNLDYLGLPALELDVEKISDKYKIIPYIENLDYYLDFDEKGFKKSNKGSDIEQMLRSKSKGAGEFFWNIKTKRGWDFGISEELILTSKLDVEKYVKRIILDSNHTKNKKVAEIVKQKYPHIEIVEIEERRGEQGYADIKKALKQKQKEKELVFQEKINNS